MRANGRRTPSLSIVLALAAACAAAQTPAGVVEEELGAEPTASATDAPASDSALEHEAEQAYADGNLPHAMTLYRQLAERRSAPRERARLLVTASWLGFQLGDADAARIDLERALFEDPETPFRAEVYTPEFVALHQDALREAVTRRRRGGGLAVQPLGGRDLGAALSGGEGAAARGAAPDPGRSRRRLQPGGGRPAQRRPAGRALRLRTRAGARARQSGRRLAGAQVAGAQQRRRHLLRARAVRRRRDRAGGGGEARSRGRQELVQPRPHPRSSRPRRSGLRRLPPGARARPRRRRRRAPGRPRADRSRAVAGGRGAAARGHPRAARQLRSLDEPRPRPARHGQRRRRARLVRPRDRARLRTIARATPSRRRCSPPKPGSPAATPPARRRRPNAPPRCAPSAPTAGCCSASPGSPPATPPARARRSSAPRRSPPAAPTSPTTWAAPTSPSATWRRAEAAFRRELELDPGAVEAAAVLAQIQAQLAAPVPAPAGRRDTPPRSIGARLSARRLQTARPTRPAGRGSRPRRRRGTRRARRRRSDPARRRPRFRERRGAPGPTPSGARSGSRSCARASRSSCDSVSTERGPVGFAIAPRHSVPGELRLRPEPRARVPSRAAAPAPAPARRPRRRAPAASPSPTSRPLIPVSTAIGMPEIAEATTGRPRRHRLEDHVGQPVDVALRVVHGRQHEEVGRTVEIGQRVVEHRPREVHAVAPGRGAPAAAPPGGHRRRPARCGARARARRSRAARLDQHVEALLGRHPADAEGEQALRREVPAAAARSRRRSRSGRNSSMSTP